MPMTGNLVALLHLCDSLFPIGSFSHSDGLEAATAQRRVTTATDLQAWMDVVLVDTLRRVEAPSVRNAWRAFSEGRLDELSLIDQELHALRPAATMREASRAMGARLLKTWQQIRPHPLVAKIVSTRAGVALPVAFGVASAASCIAERWAVEGFMYTRLAAVVSTAMRLMPIGQHEAHRILAELLTRVPSAAGAVMVETAPLRSFAPALDLAAMRQQYVHSRLFRS